MVRGGLERRGRIGDRPALAEDAIIYDLPTHGQQMQGPEAFKPYYRRMREGLSNIRVEIDNVVASGEFAVAHCRVTAQHTGNGLGIPATGRTVEFSGMAMGRIRNGKLVEGWNTFDFLAMYQQLGILPALPG